MTWTYTQSDGTLTHDGVYAGCGYSGTGDGRNNGKMQDVHDVGPIPVGQYVIGAMYNDEHLGPCVMHLDPTPETETFGRSAFRIHGDNLAHDASHGCVILDPHVRRTISTSGDNAFVVIS
jgi:hypothetical protein